MTLFIHEIKRNRLPLLIWTSAITFMLAVCVVIYPEMSVQMDEISKLFSEMGSFSAAFGMDQLNFGEFMGYFGVECGNVLGLGGAFFAAITGMLALSKEEKDHTAEFLLTHPISRTSIFFQKLLAVIAQIIALNVVVISITLLCVLAIGVKIKAGAFALIVIAYLIMQIQIGVLTFAISAFISSNGLGISLGVVLIFYFANIISNLSQELKILKYFTPFGYTDSAHIINKSSIEIKYLVVELCIITIVGVLSYLFYQKKDIK